MEIRLNVLLFILTLELRKTVNGIESRTGVMRVHNATSGKLIAEISVLSTLFKLLKRVCAKIRTTKPDLGRLTRLYTK